MDPTKDNNFASSQQWQTDTSVQTFVLKNPQNPMQGYYARSFSGNERNRTFLQTDDNFDDVSLVSGIDFREDGRGHSLFDFDQDGWLDIGLSSPLDHRFRILRNRMGELFDAKKSQHARLLLQGGASDATPQFQLSTRDAIGATAIVHIGDLKRMYQVSRGEGFSSQNSAWIHVGLGSADRIDRIEIRWPSGKQTSHGSVAAGERMIIKETDSTTSVVKAEASEADAN